MNVFDCWWVSIEVGVFQVRLHFAMFDLRVKQCLNEEGV